MKLNFSRTIRLLQKYEKDFNKSESYLEQMGLLDLMKRTQESSVNNINKIKASIMYPLIMKENEICRGL